MTEKRIEGSSSRTAAWTCVSRAASTMEARTQYQSGDDIAPILLPQFMKFVLQVPIFKAIFNRLFVPKGIYEYVIARTKYIDAVFKEALEEGFDQILIFGAGFDTRALRFREIAGSTMIFELDVPTTQNAKIEQYHKRGLSIPDNLVLIPIDFDSESLPEKLGTAGFQAQLRSLFVLEGLLMYLQPQAVDETFRNIRDIAGAGSFVVFDYVYTSVLRGEKLYYGEGDIYKTVSGAKEQWQSGIERGEIEIFLEKYGFKMIDHKDSRALEEQYFMDTNGSIVGRVNGTHCLVTAELSSPTFTSR